MTPKNGGLRVVKPIRRVSAKRATYRASKAGQDGTKYMMAVKCLDCCICGRSGPSDAHHCRSGGMARDDLKTIPLCFECHRGDRGYHARKKTWERNNGPDYSYISATQNLVAALIGGDRCCH